MRNRYTNIFKSFFHEKLFRRRVELDITQEEMADRTDTRASGGI